MSAQYIQIEDIVFAPLSTHHHFLDLTGQQFGRLTVIGFKGSLRKYRQWYCRCSCGNIIVTNTDDLRKMTTQSCGCIAREVKTKRFTKHGMYGTRVYGSWASMKRRCYDANSISYRHYGERGITVCERWRSFQNFYDDMGDPPKGTSLDRINVDGNYEPSNCRWATASEQANNKSTTLYFTLDGRTQSLTTWCQERGLPYARVAKRIQAGWTIERALDLTIGQVLG